MTYLAKEVTAELAERLTETDMRSSLVALARIEAALRQDYEVRCKSKMSDDVSIKFRKIHKKRGRKARLDEDILAVWTEHVDQSSRAIISKLRGMLKFRHWLAHGRYWNHGTKYDFQDIYILADAIVSDLPLQN
ncbi:hypothetical protein [Bosea sp. R86505]|uniref:hypothetical protein n=1 Tax=Bosea sp. R86505 TaxID=3101710 RepID=UPI00366CA236